MSDRTNNILAILGTTVPGIAAALFSFILFAPQHFEQWPILKDLAAFGLAGGLAALGINSVSRPRKGE